MRRSRSRLVSFLPAFFLAACLFAPATFADDVVSPERLRVADGELLVENGTVYGEAFELPVDLSRALAAVPERGRVEVLELPLAPGVRRSVVLRRAAVYAPGARIWIDDGTELREAPRSEKIRFLGADPSDPHWRVGLWLDPATGELGGFTASPEGEFDLVAAGAGKSGTGEYRLTQRGHDHPELESSCVQGEKEKIALPWRGTDLVGLERANAPSREALAGLAKGAAVEPTYQAVIAVDTDNEFLYKRFSNDTGAATDWIADLFTVMTVFYERDLDLHLLQGETFLRTDTGNPPNYDNDPWTGGSGASSSQLSQFSNYWNTNYNAIDRVFAMLLSGKSSSDFSASGIAWVSGGGTTPGNGTGTYCSGSIGYSVNQVFTFTGFGASTSAGLVGHEVGHNAGSSHTHCYPSPIDNCYASEPGCYSGPVSCPAAGYGSVMSYCHFGSACGTSIITEFHPTVQANIEGNIDFAHPSCIEDFELPGLIFEDGFESGSANAWDL